MPFRALETASPPSGFRVLNAATPQNQFPDSTITTERQLTAADVFPQTAALPRTLPTLQTALRVGLSPQPLISAAQEVGGPLLADVLNLPNIPIRTGIGLATGQPLDVALRSGVRGLELPTPEQQKMAGLTEMLAYPAVTQGIGTGFRVLAKAAVEAQPIRAAGEAIQSRLPINVAEAERIVRTGNPPAGFAGRLARGLTPEQRTILQARLGTATPPAPEVAYQRVPKRIQQQMEGLPQATFPTTGLQTTRKQLPPEDLLAGFAPPAETQTELFGEATPVTSEKTSNIARLKTELAKMRSLPDTPENRQRVHLLESRLAIVEEKFQVPIEVAKSLDVPVQLPTDPIFKQAVSNTFSAQLTDDGLVIDLVRFQKPEMSGEESVRTGMFYLPSGSPQKKYYTTGRYGYGGKQSVEGKTLLKRPLFIKGATGGKAVETAYDVIKGKGAYEAMRREVLDRSWTAGNMRMIPSIEGIERLLTQYDADPSMANYIQMHSTHGNTLPYAIQENIVAHAVREAGYDSVIGWSKTRKTGQPFISEVFDVRETTYPTPEGGFTLHPKFKPSLKQEGIGGTSSFIEESQKVQSLIEKHGVKNVVVKLVQAITTPEGQPALGSFAPAEAAVKITPSPMTTTGYHEAFHVLVRHANLETSLADAIAEAQRIYGGTTADAEERLAEEFARYANRETSASWSDKIRAFFEKVLNYVRRLIGKDSRVRQLFDELLNPKRPAGVSRPGVPQFQKVPGRALTVVRNRAITLVTQQLREQATLLNQERLGLRQRVLQAGGIKPTLAGGLREELQAIRPLLRQGGRSIDDLATELGFENGEALREALVAGRGARLPSMTELRQQATTIVDSEQGNRILEVIQAKGATGKAITQVVKDVTKQMLQEERAGREKVRGLLKVAEQKALTPSQIGRFAKEQRFDVGATVSGPQGGKRPAPLSEGEIRQVAARAERIVPRGITQQQREALMAGKRPALPGGPNQPPPVLPTSTALVPKEFRAQRDIPVQWTRATAEVDMQRAAQYVDGKMLGPVNQRIVQPLIQADAKAMAKTERLRAQFRRAFQGIKPDSSQDAKLLAAAENRLPEGTTLTPQESAAVEQWKSFRTQALDDVNRVLVSIGKKPLTGRKDYAPHVQELVFLHDLFGDLTRVPDVVLEKVPYLRSILETPIGQRDPNLPQAIRDLPYIPKNPSAFFLKPRIGGPYRQSLLAGVNAYIPLWARLTEITPVVQSVKPQLKMLPPHFRLLAEQWLGEQVGRKPKFDLLTDSEALRHLQRFNHMTGSSLILGKVTTVLLQYSSLANTAAKHGWFYTLRNYSRAITPHGRAFAELFCRELQQRMAVGTLLEGDVHVTRIANAALEFTDQQMVSTAFLTAFEDYTKMSAGRFRQLTGTDQTFDNILTAANISTEQTQASMRRMLQSPVTRSQVLRAIASNLQTFNVNLRQQMFVDPKVLRLATTKKEAALYQARLLADSLGMNMVYKFFGLRPPTDVGDFIPIFDPFTGMVPIGTIAKAVESGGRFIPPSALVAAAIFKAITDAKEDGKLSADTTRMVLKALMMPIPGGSQLATTLEGLATVLTGGRRNRRDPTRWDYKVEGGLDALRALTVGVTSTAGYKQYLNRGSKPEPLSDAEKATRKAMRDYERKLFH